MKAVRNHPAYWAFIGHRVSGLLLALFLPVHFYVLGLALDGADSLDRFLEFSQLPFVKVAEWGLVLLLGIHVCFGIRLLVLEFVAWPTARAARLSWIAWGAGIAFVVAAIFLYRVVSL